MKIDEYGSRYISTEYNGFTKTEYYERYLAQTVYVEPKYKTAYELSTLIALNKNYDFEKNQPRFNPLLSLVSGSLKLIPLGADTEKIVSTNKCGSPPIIRFIDNLHKFVSGSWKLSADGSYEINEIEGTSSIIRNYHNPPPAFSPKFWLPTDKPLTVYLNAVEPIGEFSNTLGKQGLSMVDIFKLGGFENGQIEIYNFRMKLERKLESSTPQYVLDAIKEKKYDIARCFYRWDYKGQHYENGQTFQSKVIYHWVKQGSVPTVQIQDFLKDVISEPRTECLPMPVAPTITNISGTWDITIPAIDSSPKKMDLTQKGNSFNLVTDLAFIGKLKLQYTRINGDDFWGRFTNGREIYGLVKGDKMSGAILTGSGLLEFTAIRVK